MEALPEETLREETVSTVDLPDLKTEPWPRRHVLPFHKLSSELAAALEKPRELTYDETRELTSFLDNYIYHYKLYAKRPDRLEVCEALAARFPHVRNGIGGGLDAWDEKVKNKMKRLRQGDSFLEVRLNREKSKVAGSKFVRNPNINPKKMELNWAPEHVIGETAASCSAHQKLMSEELSKASPDMKMISSLMSLTYSFRQMINDKAPVEVIKTAYPALFLYQEQLAEFKCLTVICLEEDFFASSQQIGPVLYSIFLKKKKSPLELNLMMEFVELNQGLDIASRVERETELFFFLFCLSYSKKSRKIPSVWYVNDYRQ
ncbi:hypothetical protein JTE90_008656 [Oedothorax gibbosus]|uniref:Uncharacterized protein n=1 Tax=Oedothorax gibbosus TaxID=931172 RepID=A0AAV6TZF4_9ARAC|nr:hypothetical protein JTE90_008656 [Oedothorax gibbosus]